MNMNKMAKFLKELREERGLTQEQLGEALNVSRSLVSKWENGNKVPAVECLAMLSKFYDITIDEIIYGERKNKDNAENIDLLSAIIMTDSRRKFKLLMCVILVLAFLLFGSYFIFNYNSIKVYSVGAKSENFDVKNTLMIISKNKSYIKFGNITDSNGDETTYDKYKFYAKDGDKMIVLSSREDDAILRNFDDKDNYLNFNNLGKYINDLYVDIYYEDKVETVKLDATLEMANNKIFNINNSDGSSLVKTKTNKNNTDLPKFIADNFTYDEEKDLYKYERNENGTNVLFNYSKKLKEFSIFKNNIMIMYNDNTKYIVIYNTESDPFARLMTFDTVNNSCLSNNCENYKNFIDDFASDYRPMIEI